MSDERPEILPVEAEREILFQRLCDGVMPLLRPFSPGTTVADVIEQVAALSAMGIIRQLRVMSARQLAVLLAAEANRHEDWMIREPPRYTAEEIADGS